MYWCFASQRQEAEKQAENLREQQEIQRIQMQQHVEQQRALQRMESQEGTSSLDNAVCFSHTFENNLGIKLKFSKYLRGSCCLASN